VIAALEPRSGGRLVPGIPRERQIVLAVCPIGVEDECQPPSAFIPPAAQRVVENAAADSSDLVDMADTERAAFSVRLDLQSPIFRYGISSSDLS